MRIIKSWKRAVVCEGCKALGENQLASHSVTDAQQLADGKWSETRKRGGCEKHPVAAMVYFNNGTSTTFELYRNSAA